MKLSERTRELATKAAKGTARFGPFFDTDDGCERNSCPLGQLFDGNFSQIMKTVPTYWKDEFSVSVQHPPNSSYIFPLLALADEFEEMGL